MTAEKLDLLKGTLDLLVLQNLSSMGPLQGYAWPGGWSRSAATSWR